MTMFKLDLFGGLTIIPSPCTDHAGCTEYSVIPSDPTQCRYGLHSAGPNAPTDELRMEELDAILQSRSTPY